MTLTRAQAETILVRRVGGLLSAAGLAVTTAGSNADLNDPLAWAIGQAGGTVSDRSAVVDADLVTVSGDDQLLDLAELRALETVAGNLATVDVTFGPHSEKLGQLGSRLELLIARKRKQVAADHGVGAPALEAGVVTLAFAQQRGAGSE
jgi:hypothetical protein